MKTPSTKAKKNSGLVFPYQFTKNGRTGKIYKLGNGTFATKFTFAGKRIQNTFGTVEKAVEFLDGEFVKLDDDRANALSLTPLNGDVKHYSELEHLLRQEGGGASLKEAVSFFLANHKHKRFTPQTFTYCYKEFMAAKKDEGISTLQLTSLNKHLRRFENEHGKRLIHEISADEIGKWLRECKDIRTGDKWSAKTRTSVRNSLASLSIYARKFLKAIPDVGETEFQKVTIPKPDNKPEVEIYTPNEIEQLLLTAIERDVMIIPSIVLGSFAGLRPFEFHAEGMNGKDDEKKDERKPLDWAAFNWATSTLFLRHQKVRSKATRHIPISANLKAWLEPFIEKEGPIWKFKQAHTKKLIALRDKAGVRSIYDGFRHSYASYRIHQLKQNLALLAAEMGNSPEEITGHYKANVPEAEATKWFSIMPPAGYAEKIKTLLEIEAAGKEA